MVYGYDINNNTLTEKEVNTLKAGGKLFEVRNNIRHQFSNAEETIRAKGDADHVVEVARMKKIAYREKRASDYPPIGDQFDDLYHKGLFSDEMSATLKAVKDKHPK